MLFCFCHLYFSVDERVVFFLPTTAVYRRDLDNIMLKVSVLSRDQTTRSAPANIANTSVVQAH